MCCEAWHRYNNGAMVNVAPTCMHDATCGTHA
jgi:hypothetical protein